MMKQAAASRLPKPNSHYVVAITPADLAAAYVAAQRHGRCSKDQAVQTLEELVPAEQALAAAIKKGLILERDGHLLQRAEHAEPKGAVQPTASPAWIEIKRALAFRALSYVPGANGKRAKRDLAAVGLRQVYGLDNLSPTPSRAEVRCELVRRIVASLGDPFAANASRTAKAFKFDAMSRSIYLAFAGLSSGSVLQADAALLSAAFKGAAATVSDLSATIIRAALGAQETLAQNRGGSFDLDGFAELIRDLARKLETKPYAGRVAIAQVYDAGLDEGLDLGTLDDFKAHLAEAAREGLLDLERYDIAGPFDAALKERSRLRLGRDERHFIVNQSI